MADGRDLTELLRRATLLNLRVYQRAVDLSLDYLRELGAILQAKPAAAATRAPSSGTSGTSGTSGETGDSGVIVLEAESGSVAAAAFLVTNDLDRSVSIKMRASSFADAEGERVPQPLEFTPAQMELAPGSRQVVTVSARIAGDLTPGLPYRGEIAVEGMKDLAVPVVLRRRHSVADAAAVPVPPSTTRRKAGSRGARAGS